MQIPIVSVAAWSGTGKTTYLEKLIPEFKRRGLRVAALKHDAHDFDIDREGKDSWRMTQAGADVTIIASKKKTVVMENRSVAIKKVLETVHDVDLIVTEGFKFGAWPKLVLFRAAVGKPLLDTAENCVAIVTDDAVKTDKLVLPFADVKHAADLLLLAVGLGKFV